HPKVNMGIGGAKSSLDAVAGAPVGGDQQHVAMGSAAAVSESAPLAARTLCHVGAAPLPTYLAWCEVLEVLSEDHVGGNALQLSASGWCLALQHGRMAHVLAGKQLREPQWCGGHRCHRSCAPRELFRGSGGWFGAGQEPWQQNPDVA